MGDVVWRALNSSVMAHSLFPGAAVSVELDEEWLEATVLKIKPGGIKVKFKCDGTTAVVPARSLTQRVFLLTQSLVDEVEPTSQPKKRRAAEVNEPAGAKRRSTPASFADDVTHESQAPQRSQIGYQRNNGERRGIQLRKIHSLN